MHWVSNGKQVRLGPEKQGCHRYKPRGQSEQCRERDGREAVRLQSWPRNETCRQDRGEKTGPALGHEGKGGSLGTRGRRGVLAWRDAGTGKDRRDLGKGRATGPRVQAGGMVAPDPRVGKNGGEGRTGHRPKRRGAQGRRGSVPAGHSRPYRLAALLPVIGADLGPTQTPSRGGIQTLKTEFSR